MIWGNSFSSGGANDVHCAWGADAAGRAEIGALLAARDRDHGRLGQLAAPVAIGHAGDV